MSGICGLFQRDGSPVDPADLRKMTAAMAPWGPDGRSQLVDGSVGLGQLMLHNTPQAHLEKLPRQTASGLLLTAEARIDNRSELCQIFNIPQPEREHTTDSTLIELAYEKWGKACPDHILGDWAFAIWQPQTQQLFIARDHYGNTALYYAQDATRFAFASSREALLALGIPRRLNELYLAQVLISWAAYHGEETIDLDIFRLPGAHAMMISPKKTDKWPYWRLEDTPELNLPTFEAYVAGFLETYRAAVSCRLRSSKPVGVTLSGGLDSGSVTGLAAPILQAQGQRLSAYTAVPLYETINTVSADRFGDETEFARETAAFFPNIDHQLQTASGISPVDGIRKILAIRNEPGHAAANFYWLADLLQTAQRQGVGTLLTGQGGNATVSWTGAPYLRSFWQMWQVKGWKTAVKQRLPLAVQRGLRLRRLKKANWQFSAIHPAFAKRLNLAQLQAKAIGQGYGMPESIQTALELRWHILKPGTSLLGATWAEIGAGYGLEVRDPTIDKRVLTYTFSIPDQYFVGPQGEDRWLLRRAMGGILPDKVRFNLRRGRQAADLGHRLRNSANEVNYLLSKLKGSQAESYIDLQKMSKVWENIQNQVGQKETQTAVTILMRGLNAGLFFVKNDFDY